MWPNSAPLRSTRLQNQSDIEFELSRSLKVKYNAAVGLPYLDVSLVIIQDLSRMFEHNVSMNVTQIQLLMKVAQPYTHSNRKSYMSAVIASLYISERS